MKRVTFATCHSQNIALQAEVKPAISIPLEGGSPYFGYIWIDDVCYTIIKTAHGYKIHKTK
jgi:hypothetical protein